MLAFARQFDLTIYAAAYQELVQPRGVIVATFDALLIKTAKKEYAPVMGKN